MIPFDAMEPEEQRHHIEEVHGILYLRDDTLVVQHDEDHQRLAYDHEHDACRPAPPVSEEQPRNDKTCSACGDKYGSQEEPRHPSLCPYCASKIDRDTEAQLEREHFDWFE
jgi:hypothetical protein